MTTATKIKNEVRSIEEESWTYPYTASEAFQLGIGMQQMIVAIYDELENCEKQCAQNTMWDFRKQYEADIASFTDYLLFTLNTEMDDFYQNGGRPTDNEAIKRQLADTKLLIKRNIENYITKIKTIYVDLELGEYKVTANSDDILEINMGIRTAASELYNRLAKLYPAGEIKNAFEVMARTIDKGSNQIASCYSH